MTPEAFQSLYLDLESRIDTLNTLIQAMDKDRQALINKQAALSTDHLNDLTTLRDGQTIILDGQTCVIESVMAADMVCENENGQDVDRLEISVWIAPSILRQLEPQPGEQWRYPEAVTSTPKEAA